MTVRQDDATPDVSGAPGAFVYFQSAQSPYGATLTARMERMAKADLALPDAVIEQMGRSLDEGDRLGDAWYADARRRGSVRDARAEYTRALQLGIDAIEDPSPPLVALMEQIHTEPEWLDWDLLERGARVQRRYGRELHPYFGMMTFAGYRTPSVTKPLILTGAYTGNSALNRFWETCKFWTDSSEPGGLRPGGDGFDTALRVRLLHCMIRARILPHPEWDRSRLGVPISQFNMFTTLMAGSIFPGTQLKKIGYRTSDDDIAALLHMQRYIGYIMGVEPSWYPETVVDGLRAMRVIALSQRTEDNDDSRRLCWSFMDAYKPDPGLTGWQRRKAELEYRFQLGHAHFYDPTSYTKTGFPPIGLWRFAPLLRFVPNFVRETACRRVPGVAAWVDGRHRRWREAETRRTLGAGAGSYSPVETLSR